MLNYLPPFIENKQEKIGKVLALTIPEPGIYRLVTELYEELYIVPFDYDGDALPRDVFQYGEALDDVVLFDIGRGQLILEYELARRRRENVFQDWEINYYDALLLSLSEAERPYTPQYFGSYPPPTISPVGAVTRYQSISNGAYLVDSGGNWFVALSRAIADLDKEPFSPYLAPMSAKSDYYFITKEKFPPIASEFYGIFPGLEAVIPPEKA